MIRILALLLVLLANSVSANSDGLKAARDAVNEIKSAHDALKKARQSSSRVLALGRAVRAYEDGLAAMRDGFRIAAHRQATLQSQLEDQQKDISELLGVLQQIERAPAPLLLAHPNGPLGAARAALMMGEITPSLQTRADALRLKLDELKSIAVMQALAESELRAGLADLQTARSDLTEALRKRRKLPPRIGASQAKLASMAQNARDLDSFAKALISLEGSLTSDPVASFETGQGSLRPPVAGLLHRGFKEPDAGGIARPGVILSAPPLSIVTSPWPSTLRYVGSLLDYGTVAILEPQPGYLLVLAGLGEVFVSEGTVIARGDPIGLLNGSQPNADEFLIDVTKGKSFIRNESLYIELRHDGTPIDPTPWFVLDRDEKGSK